MTIELNHEVLDKTTEFIETSLIPLMESNHLEENIQNFILQTLKITIEKTKNALNIAIEN